MTNRTSRLSHPQKSATYILASLHWAVTKNRLLEDFFLKKIYSGRRIFFFSPLQTQGFSKQRMHKGKEKE